MIRSMYFSPENKLQTDVPVSTFSQNLAAQGGLLWVDFQDSPPREDEPILLNVFGFHPLAVDDALQESHVPKVDDWGEYVYIVLHAISFDPGNEDHLQTHELDIFLGKNYVVTHHDEPIEALDRVWNTIFRDERHLKSGGDHLLYRLVDEVIANYMPVVDAMDEVIDVVEDEVFNRPTPYTLERIFRLKRAALHLRRIIGPQREVLNRLARDDYPVIDDADRVYFRDIYDHLVRLYDITENLRDLVSGSLDTYLSVVNNRMNDIMKTLTIITTLFMPISFVVGFFGMNFFAPSVPLYEWTSSPAFYLTMAVLIGTPMTMFVWMRQKRWM